jgi:hypothetical protein
MDNLAGFRVYFDRESRITGLNYATQKGDTAERQQCRTAACELCRPVWTPGTQSNLRVEKLNVGLIKLMLLQRCDIACALAQWCRQTLHRPNSLSK